jgi:putative ABC transport system permease protein
MSWTTWRSLAAGLFRRRRIEDDLSAEIQFHIETRARDLVARGMDPADARRTARIEFGSIERYKEEVRGARGLRLFDEVAADLIGGGRALRRAPGFTLAAGLSLALGIGANTLVFSLLDSTVLKPLALQEPERLVAIWTAPVDQPEQLGTSSITRYTEFRDHTRSFESVAAYNGLACGVKVLGFEQDGVAPERILGQTVSPSMFRTLGVQPMIGRAFTDAEDVVDQVAPVVVIGHRMWQRRFGGDPAIVGTTLTLDRAKTTIIGVMPEGFDFFGKDREFLSPLCLTRAQVEGRTGGNSIIARLKPGVSITQAQAELDALSSQLASSDPRRHQGFIARVESLNRANARTFDAIGQPVDYVSALSILQGAVGLVLLISCANVAGLLLARGASRRNEVALRMTLGAGRWRVTRQVLTEGLPLAVVGATAGVAIAWIGLRVFVAVAPPNFPRLDEAAINIRVLGFTALVVLVTAALFALIPAMQASRVAMADVARESSRTATGSAERQRMRSLLVCGQIALALVLLVGAGLMIHSFMRALQNELGADPTNVLTFDFRLPPRDSFKAAGLFRGSGLFEISPVPAEAVERVRQRLQTVPGVQSVAAVTAAPFATGIWLEMPFVVDGRALPPSATAGSPASEQQRANYTAVSPGYFSVMRIPLRRGRDFDDHDRSDAPYVAIISDAMARKYFPNEDPIGQYIRFDFVPNERPRQIVGIVGDTLVGLLQTSSSPAVYVPHVQQGPTFAGPFVYLRIGMSFVLRTAGDPMALVPAVKRAVAEVDPTTPIASVRTIEQSLDDSIRHLRLYMLLLGAFGAVATLLAAIGIYGVMAYSVAERTREFGVRMALGARGRDVLVMVLRRAARIVAAGVVIGLTTAVFVSRLLQASLFQVTRTDPATYLSVSMLLILIALMACVIPARRATAVNPIVALRHE